MMTEALDNLPIIGQLLLAAALILMCLLADRIFLSLVYHHAPRFDLPKRRNPSE